MAPGGSGRYVLKVSGSLIYPPREGYLGSLREVIVRLHRDEGLGIAVVTGGGGVSREYIGALRGLGVSEALLDLVGIWVARVNALALSTLLYPYSHPKPIASIEEALEAFSRGLIPVMGGLQPGQSTNAVAASLSEALRATLINMLAGVEGVYSGPPGDRGSRLLRRVTYSEMEELISRHSQEAGRYELFDKVALGIVKRGGVRVVFVDGSDPEILVDVIKGARAGTELVPDDG